MKTSIAIILLLLSLFSCNGQQSGVKEINDQTDSSFFKGLSDFFEKPFKLSGDLVISDGDTIHYPDVLPLKKEVEFNATKNNDQLWAIFKRIDLTHISYSFKQVDKDNKVVLSRAGIAVLMSAAVMEDKPGYLTFFPSYKDSTSGCKLNLMFSMSEEVGGLTCDLHLSCLDKATGYPDTDYYALLFEVGK